MRHVRVFLMTVVILAIGVPHPAQAQPTNDAAQRLYATRAQLEAQLARFEQGASVEGYSEHVREVARTEADLIRERLEEGDIQVGDQIQLTVQGMPSLTNTFTVTDGRVLFLPDVGAVQLAGLLRSELQQGIREHLAKFIVDPQVLVRSSIRLSVQGAVGTPGYHTVQSDVVLTDVLAQAGQPSSTARQDKMVIKRSGDVIWEGEELEEAIIQGRTLDQMNLRAGDRIEVPAQSTGGVGSWLRSLYYIVPLSLALMRLLN